MILTGSFNFFQKNNFDIGKDATGFPGLQRVSLSPRIPDEWKKYSSVQCPVDWGEALENDYENDDENVCPLSKYLSDRHQTQLCTVGCW